MCGDIEPPFDLRFSRDKILSSIGVLDLRGLMDLAVVAISRCSKLSSSRWRPSKLSVEAGQSSISWFVADRYPEPRMHRVMLLSFWYHRFFLRAMRVGTVS